MPVARLPLLCCVAVCFVFTLYVPVEAFAVHPKILRLIESREIDDAIERIERRIRSGKVANQEGDDGITALHMAAQVGSLEVLLLLLENGAEVDRQDELGRTPLALAAGSGQLAAARYLLARGASTNVSNLSGVTPLMHAVRARHYYLVRELLESGADINAVDVFGTDVLMHAATVPAVDQSVIELLFEHGVGVDTVDKQGLSAMYIARSRGSRFLMDELSRRGVNLEFAVSSFEARQLVHEGYYLGVQLGEPNGKCEDPRFDIKRKRAVSNRLAQPAWADAEDCYQAIVEDEIECDLVYACISRDSDQAHAMLARQNPIIDSGDVPPEMSENDAVIYLDPDNPYLQMGFFDKPQGRGRSTRLAVGLQKLQIGFGANVSSGSEFSESQYMIALSNLKTAGYLHVSGDPGGSLLELSNLIDAAARYSYILWFRHDLQFEAEPGRVYKVFSDLAQDPVSGDHLYDIRIVDYDTTDIVFESRGNPARRYPSE